MAIFNSYVSLPEGIGDDQKSRNWEILFANQLQYRDDTGFWTLFNSGFLEWNGEAGYVLAILALYVCRGLWMSRKSARLSFRKPALNGHLHGKIIELNSRFSKDMCHHPEGNPDFFFSNISSYSNGWRQESARGILCSNWGKSLWHTLR